jgi:hypothetical protein
MNTPKPTIVPPSVPEDETPISIAKPPAFDLECFKSKRSPSLGGVKTKLGKLPHHRMVDANDFVRLHPDETYWSTEMCFVKVPTKGVTETLHLINEDLAMRYLPSARIKRFRLALAVDPQGNHFLCHVPSQNLDNSFNNSNVKGCIEAKTRWTQLTSRKSEGVDDYKIEYADSEEAFAEPVWPPQTLDELIFVTFEDHMITSAGHPGLLRLRGAKQSLS